MARTPADESERLTRKSRIDPKLIEQGWEILPSDPHRPISQLTHHAVEEYETDNGPADYALFVDGQLLKIQSIEIERKCRRRSRSKRMHYSISPVCRCRVVRDSLSQ
jgi:type I site-specific restriction endonuclease